MEKEAEKIFCELREDISTYLQLKYKLLKLNATERVAKLIAILSQGIILILLFFFTILFLFLALGFYLGLVVAFLLGRHKVQEKIVNIMINALWAEEDGNDED